MYDKVDEKDISFVFHGPVAHRNGSLITNVQNTKKIFPNSEYILSTWEGADSSVFPYFDKVILNKDPGPVAIEPVTGYANNVLRQVVCTANGLKAATKLYAVKIRSDFAVTHSGFIELWSKFIPANPDFLYFKKPVAILSLGCNDPVRTPGLFHCSDFFYFGLKEDLLTYWDVENQIRAEEDRLLTVFEKIKHPLYGLSFNRLPAEQELFRNFIQKKCNKQFEFKFRDLFSKDLLILSETVMLNNFVLMNHLQAGVFVTDRISNIAKLDHHYIPSELAKITNAYEANVQNRKLRAVAARYKSIPKQFLLSVYALSAYFIKKTLFQRAH